MTFPLVVGSATGILVFISVIAKPFVNIGKMRLGTYWIISLAGAVLILLSGTLPVDRFCCQSGEDTHFVFQHDFDVGVLR